MSSQVGRKPGSHVRKTVGSNFRLCFWEILRMHVLQAFQEPRRCAEAACTGEVVNKYDHTLGEPGHSLHSSQLRSYSLPSPWFGWSTGLIYYVYLNSCLQMLIAAIFLLVNLSNIPNIKWWHPPNILRNLWIQGTAQFNGDRICMRETHLRIWNASHRRGHWRG